MTVCIVLEKEDTIMSKSAEPCDPKEYAHLLYERRLYKNGRIEKGDINISYYFYIKKERLSEDQDGSSRKYHVALLYTGELVCVNNGWIDRLVRIPDDELYIGEGIFHHNEYYSEP